MGDTRERILHTALELFAANGYEAVSVREIAEALGMTKGALYRHYANKRDIFESILRRMEQQDARSAAEHALPEAEMAADPEAYEDVSAAAFFAFSRAQFCFWTEDAFAAAFRKMLTLEQYGSAEMGALYEQYLGSGPLGYTADILGSREKALAFYGGMQLLYSIYDHAADKAAAKNLARAHFAAWEKELKA